MTTPMGMTISSLGAASAPYKNMQAGPAGLDKEKTGSAKKKAGSGKDLEQIKSEQYGKIMAHEQAHASAAGSFGGGIHIVYDNNGIAVAGYVPVQLPALNPLEPHRSYAQAAQVYAAATAPADMSGADSGVAAAAQSIMGRAQVLMSQKQQREQQLQKTLV